MAARKRILITKKIPCGRTEETKHMCCTRAHKWYNSYWIIVRLKRPRVVLEDDNKRIYAWEKRCLFCGHVIQLGGHPFEKDAW